MWSTGRTGGTNAIFNVADRLSKLGHEIIIISLGAKEHTWFKFEHNIQFYYPEVDLFPHFRIKFRNNHFSANEIFNWFLSKVNLNLSFDRHKILSNALDTYASYFDIIIATYFETAFSVNRMDSKKCIKFYYIQHFESVFFTDEYNKKRVQETYFLPFKWITNSSWVNARLIELTGKQGNVVIPGVDTSVYYPRRVNKDKDNKVIVSLGKSASVKGLEYLFKALNKLATQVRGIKLVLYGIEPDLKKDSPVLTEYIVSPSNDQLADLYSMADVVVTPSLYESSPLPPLEAMACGAPVVTTIFGTEDYCIDGENSIVVPPGHPNSLTNAIYRILTDSELANKLKNNGLRKSKELSWDKTAEYFEKFLRKNVS